MEHYFDFGAASSSKRHASIPRGSLNLVARLGLFLFLAVASTQSCAEGDLWGGKRTFAANLSAANQLTVTNSKATGNVKIIFDIATKTITWDISYQDLTSTPTAIRLHGPAQPGTNAAPLIDLGTTGLSSPIKGSSVVTAAHVQYLLLGWTYVSLASKRYPNGEIRGKVDVVPPPGLPDHRPNAR